MDRLAGRLVERLRGEPEEPSVVGLDDEEADKLFDALGSETSRAVLAACYERGRTRSELADDLETSIQNVGYHVDKLESAGLLEPVETRYGENGREVRVYEPSKRAVIVAAGEPGLVERLADALERLFAPVVLVGLVAMVAAVVARGPERLKMLGDDAAAETTTRAAETAPLAGEATTVSAVVAGVAAFLLGLAAVLIADRRGAFDRDETRRTGRQALLVGHDSRQTRRTAAWSVALGLGAFLAVDVTLTGATRVAGAAAVAALLAVPLGTVVATFHARLDGGILVSWLASSAPIAGIWGYFVAGEAVRSGLEPGLVAAGVASFLLLGFPLGSVAYLVGSLARRRAGDASGPSRRVVVALAAHPVAVVLLVVGWLRFVL
ncbi:ArsR/SmtB family transcription factor [Natronobeatus ordinarius]|uniref:ArsR/SmtB family transcription factor n=1 Tax=Natronobeatus ordinarius TaxID=2963433 RepID=UPI0020CD6D3A|nr:helix-turn-helix domain-containing protein [Natronobeatus ordinarius]